MISPTSALYFRKKRMSLRTPRKVVCSVYYLI